MMISSNPEESEGTSTFFKLNNLCTSIESSIRTYSEKPGIDKELLSIRQISFREPAPEAEYATRLFDKLLNDTIALKKDGNNRSMFEMMAIPPELLDGTGEQLVGMAAMNKNIFWLRIINAILSLGSLIMMSLVPNILDTIVQPDDIFSMDCRYRSHISGSFDFTAFQFALCVSALLFGYSVTILVFYILPIDIDNHKYIPGLGAALRSCFDAETLDTSGRWVGRLLLRESKSSEALLDTAFWLLTVISAVMAAVTLGQARPFALRAAAMASTGDSSTSTGSGITDVDGDIDDDALPFNLYLSPASFYATFHRTTPCCADEQAVALVRAAVALLFLCVVTGVLTIQVSINSFRKERALRVSRSTPRGSPRMNAVDMGQSPLTISGDYSAVCAGDGDGDGDGDGVGVVDISERCVVGTTVGDPEHDDQLEDGSAYVPVSSCVDIHTEDDEEDDGDSGINRGRISRLNNA